jgi:hypothetical protein
MEQFSQSLNSPFEYFDIHNWFGVDTKNQVLALIFSILGLNILIIILLYILSIYLIFIYIYNSKSEFKFIDKYLPSKYSEKIKLILIRILKNWNRSNYLIVIVTLLLLFIFSISSTYFIYHLYNNFDKWVELYLKYKNLK